MNGPVGAPAIRTPDQRLRVFVSSTLRELEPERRAARTAIERTRTGLIEQRSYITFRPFVDQMLASERAGEFEAGRERGRMLSRHRALELVLGHRDGHRYGD